MANGIRRSAETHFGKVKDPRVDRTKLHELLDIITMTLCAVVCGADGWTAIAEFAKSKRG